MTNVRSMQRRGKGVKSKQKGKSARRKSVFSWDPGGETHLGKKGKEEEKKG